MTRTIPTGAGSVFPSHVNDAGFRLVKEYFGMTVGQAFATWSLMGTRLSVTALGVTRIVAAALGVLGSRRGRPLRSPRGGRRALPDPCPPPAPPRRRPAPARSAPTGPAPGPA